MRNRLITLGFCALFALSMSAAELRVHAAASLSDALTEIGSVWESRGGPRLRFNFGGSSLLARQIEEGAPADVFVSADEAKMDALDRKGLIVRDSRRALLSNALVVIVPADSTLTLKSAADLASPRVTRLALAEPSTAPAGIYAKQWLERTGVWPKVSSKVVTTENVRGALLAVEGGNVDAGVVYATDAKIAKGVRVAYIVAGPDAPSISYPAAVLSESADPVAARRLVVFLGSSEAKEIFVRHGFVVK
jgi:molybdate transport system substrate-binding protein